MRQVALEGVRSATWSIGALWCLLRRSNPRRTEWPRPNMSPSQLDSISSTDHRCFNLLTKQVSPRRTSSAALVQPSLTNRTSRYSAAPRGDFTNFIGTGGELDFFMSLTAEPGVCGARESRSQ